MGVTAEGSNCHTIRVQAKTVIISTGDFADNKEMLKKYTDLCHMAINRLGNLGRMGDGVQLAWAVEP